MGQMGPCEDCRDRPKCIEILRNWEPTPLPCEGLTPEQRKFDWKKPGPDEEAPAMMTVGM